MSTEDGIKQTLPNEEEHHIEYFKEDITNFQDALTEFNTKLTWCAEQAKELKAEVEEEKNSTKDLAADIKKKTERYIADASTREVELEKFKLQYALLFGKKTVTDLIEES